MRTSCPGQSVIWSAWFFFVFTLLRMPVSTLGLTSLCIDLSPIRLPLNKYRLQCFYVLKLYSVSPGELCLWRWLRLLFLCSIRYPPDELLAATCFLANVVIFFLFFVLLLLWL